MKLREKPAERVWAEFAETCHLTPLQLEQFQRYDELLEAANAQFNLTAITSLSGIVRQHFQDSLALTQFFDLNSVKMIADIGTGAGFPGIPLKIMYPHLEVVLIEVTHKKREFLQDVVNQLGLTGVTICEYDWRTFLRVTEYPIDLFVTRAALDEMELERAFRPACRYRNATLVYWVTGEWEPNKKVAGLVKQQTSYKLAAKNRKLAFFAL